MLRWINVSHPFRLVIICMLNLVVRVIGVITMVWIPLFISRLVSRWFRIIIIFPFRWVILDRQQVSPLCPIFSKRLVR